MCKIFSFLFLLCISISADMVVIVDWANVRENPGTDARRIAQLPFGTWVKTTEVINGWAHIKIVENQEILGNVSGWVSSSLLKEMEPSSFLREIENYRTSDSLELLLRCAVSSDSCAAALHKYYTERNDQRGLAKWRELYDSTFFRPAYIAIRDCDQMRVIGYVDSTGSFTSLEIYSESEYSSEETQITAHIPEIRKKKWYVLQSGTDKYRSYFFSPASDWIDDVDPDRCSYGLMPPVGITLGGFKESYQKENYTVLSSEPMTPYLSETASYTQSCSLDIQNALKTIKRHFKTEEADTAVSIPDARIKSYSVTSLPFGYREITLRGDLVPGESVSLSAFKVILDKEDNVVWPRPDDYYVYEDNLDLNDEVTDFWLSFDNLKDNFYRIMPVVNSSAYFPLYDDGGSWGYQLLRLSPGGFSVLHNRTDGT